MKAVRSWAAGVFLISMALLQCAWGQEVLRDAAAIRALPRQRATQGLPVDIQGTVIFSYLKTNWEFVIFDKQQGIFVARHEALAEGILPPGKEDECLLKPGMLVRLKGVTGAGDYAPVILPNHIEVIGTGELPAYVPVSMADLQTGSFDSQPVSIRGVIQRVDNPKWMNWMDDSGQSFDARLLVALKGGGHITVGCVRCNRSEVGRLVDAMVELHGVACTFFNFRAEAVGVWLEMNDETDITVIDPGPTNPFAAPLTNIGDLLPFSPVLPSLHRKCVRGTITFCQPGKYFYMQEGDEAVRVTSQQTDPLAVGDVVQVSGFVEMAQYFDEIREAVFRKIGRASVPAPVPITLEDVFQNAQSRAGLKKLGEGRLVQINGQVERIDLNTIDGPTMWLKQAGRTITVLLGPDFTQKDAAKWDPGSQVAITGICVISLQAAWPALDAVGLADLHILSRSPADIVLVHPASWWNIRHLVSMLAGTTATLVLVLGWAWILRRSLARQTRKLALEIRARHDAEVEFKATMRERNRLAADLHDTLEQDLTATALQLEAARALRKNSPDAATQRTELACELLDHSRDGLRRSVLALRIGILEGRTFAEALCHLASRTERIHGIPCECSVQDDGSHVSEFEANHLLLFVQEALTNALKHASPCHVTIALLINRQRISITVADDGSGFDTQNTPGPQQGHFGLLGMKERLNALGGTLVIHSSPGQGTRVEGSVLKEAKVKTSE